MNRKNSSDCTILWLNTGLLPNVVNKVVINLVIHEVFTCFLDFFFFSVESLEMEIVGF